MTVPTSREIAHAAIRERLAQVTLEQVLHHGYDRLTLNDLAAASGVSRSTFLRYLGSKEDAVLAGLAATGSRLADELLARPSTEGRWPSLRRAMDYIARLQHQDDAGALNLTRLINATSSLGGAQWRHQLSWRTSLTTALRRRSPDLSPVTATALAAAALGCLDAATATWVESGGELDFGALLDEAFGALGPVGE
ncbi:TetR/AcrR family transcriptional regulator [Streptomyces sp. JW3]|uniref:TetR/AcrR family transcriptional regulator n=1 Tax=Streptomyces sp. JW3 TaxID=3456955 RepID=UPI003FA414F0